ncbi:formylglycine-generating enzyme family protein [Glutamicibacter arilaitensis]|uniref:formylglycine-generating enzyme family protein n=1 Tax=Glutamicibacter arilaitensis TaxID=256701 RepID=UPI00384E054C
MIQIPGGTFSMGSNDFYREEQPVHQVEVSTFLLDRAPVTVEQFHRFVADTGYVTVAERALNPSDYPGVRPELLVPGALVFTPTQGPVPLHDPTLWWSWVAGASWRQTEGPGSDALVDRSEHPVTQVSYEDAAAYARWAGKRLPTESEHEFAAHGGREGTLYAWGDERCLAGQHMANTWLGRFPYENSGLDGWVGTSPVGSFPANEYGAVDLIGNVWEWTADRWTAHQPVVTRTPCCTPDVPRNADSGLAQPRDTFVVKGGSHLCSPEYCLRYRPAARQPQERDTATSHMGFRCAQDFAAP